MKKTLLLLLALGFGVTAAAQSRDNLASGVIQTERDRITTERLSREADFNREEVACYKKFFTNRCLKEVQARQRKTMTLLRQQEVVLNDRERKEKAAAQIQKIDEKSSPEAQQQAAERRTQALEDGRQRVERSQQKADQAAVLKQQEALNAADAMNKAKGALEKSQARAAKQAAAAEEIEKYNQKQQQVKERKASREQEQRARTKPPAKPLPIPD